MDRRSRWTQFGLGTLLFVMFCVGGFLAGYMRGYSAGEQRRYAEGFYAKAYYVSDLIAGPPVESSATESATCLQSIVNVIETTVSPTSWNQHGGLGVINFFERNGSVVVYARKDVQQQVADLLEQLRRIKRTTSEQGRDWPVSHLDEPPVDMCAP